MIKFYINFKILKHFVFFSENKLNKLQLLETYSSNANTNYFQKRHMIGNVISDGRFFSNFHLSKVLGIKT